MTIYRMIPSFTRNTHTSVSRNAPNTRCEKRTHTGLHVLEVVIMMHTRSGHVSTSDPGDACIMPGTCVSHAHMMLKRDHIMYV
jgi:hypothetical protein